ncbi:DNA-directed RNA polymerase specialized sigma subunit, partial [Lachnospiraceae bacterium JC7]
MTNEELVKLIQSGCNPRENMGLLYEQNEPLIEQYVQPLSVYCEIEDLKQEAFFGMQRAIEKYNPNAGYKFMSYAKAWIIKSAIRYVNNNGTVKRLPAHMKQRIRTIKSFCEKYKMMNGKTPTDNEICSGTGLKQSQLDN